MTATTSERSLVSGSDARRARVRRLAAWTPFLVLVVLLLQAVSSGLSTTTIFRAIAAVGMTQTAPGMVAWRAVRGDGSWFEDVVVGTAIGAAASIPLQAVAGLVGWRWPSWLVLPLLAGVLLRRPAVRLRVRTAPTCAIPWWFGPAVSLPMLALVPGLVSFQRRVPLVWDGFASTYVDMPFHLSLVGQLAHRGPTSFPYIVGDPLAYHWFSHAWVAQVERAGGGEAAALLFRVIPALMVVLVPCMVAVVAVRLSRSWVAGPVAAVIAVFAGDLDLLAGGSRGGSLVDADSPSLGLATVFLLLLVVSLERRWRGQLVGPRVGAGLVFALGIITAGTKGSALPVIVAGCALGTVVALVRKHPSRWRMATDLGLLVASLLVVVLVLFRGGAQDLTFDIVGGLRAAGPTKRLASVDPIALRTILGGIVILVVGTLARGAGALALVGRLEREDEPLLATLLGTGIAGAGAVLLLVHAANSQVYFLRNAAPALAVASGWGIAAFVRETGRTWRVPIVIGIEIGLVALWFSVTELVDLSRSLAAPWVTTPVRAALARLAALLAVLAIGALFAWWRGGRRSVSAVLGVAVLVIAVTPVVTALPAYELPASSPSLAPTGARAFGWDQVVAARWLRDHSDGDAVVATNRHCGVPATSSCDSRRFHVAAWAERQVLVEGWAYTPSWFAAPQPDMDRDPVYKPFHDPALIATNDDFMTEPSAEGRAALRSLGVDWLFIDKTVPYSSRLDEFAVPRHETEWAWVLELTSDRPETR